MKSRNALLLVLSLAAAGLSARADEYQNFLRQIHYDTAVVWDVPVGQAGTMRSPLGVGDHGSMYELWALDSSANAIDLDREFISSYTPKIDVVFETGDPYQATKRTRVDQPFTARITVSGMDLTLKDEQLTTLQIVHLGFLFPDQEYNLNDVGGANEPQVIREFSITNNGEFTFQFPMTNLNGPDLTKLFGAELFTITSPGRYNNGGGNNADGVDGDKLSKRLDIILQDEVKRGYVFGNIFEWTMLQIWPIADATIEGIDSNTIYHDVPPVSIRLVDLYPDSTTYLRVYKGPPSASPSDPVEVGPAAVIIRDTTPQDRTIVVTNLEDYLPEEGSYTLEVLHKTPFGTEILAQTYPLQVDWDIDFKGSIFSSD